MVLHLPAPYPGENNRAYAHRALRTNIMTLRLPPGTVLNEAALSERLHMSRTPVHEALAMLRDEWLVEVFPQRGTRVTRIDPALVKEGYETRLLLESALLRDTAGTLGRVQVQQLLHCMHQLEGLVELLPNQVAEAIRLDDELHRMIYEFGGRARTWQAIRGLVSHYDRLRFLDALEGAVDFARVTRQHREFCDYLMMGLPEGVDPTRKMREHLTSFRGDLLQRVERHPGYFALEE